MPDENTPKPIPSSVPAREAAGALEKPHVEMEPEVLERIAGEIAIRAITISRESYSGPMPTPAMFEQYDQTLPGTALVIRDEFQANAAHVREQEGKALTAQIESDRANRQVAQQLVWGAFLLIALTALTGHENVAIALAVTTIIGIIAGFLGKRTSSDKDQS